MAIGTVDGWREGDAEARSRGEGAVALAAGDEGEIRPGALVGRYRILRRIGKGGMAEVFLADAGGGRAAAIKCLHPHLAEQASFLEMFLDEARIAATLHHPNVVQVYEVAASHGNLYMAMEFLHGEDVHSIIRSSTSQRRRVPVEHALHVILSVCEGLHYAHEMRGEDGRPLRLVHRDVSPQNIVVSFDGGVKLLDFGIAKSAQQNTATRTGTLKGKVSYMSPEQCLGERLDRRSDIFSLGIVLYELTLSRRLYRGRTDFDVMRSIVEGQVARPSELDPGFDAGLEAVVMRALDKDPARRFQTARELSEALEEVVERLSLSLTPGGMQRFLGRLFAPKVDAWRAARAEGRTLLQHLAEVDDSSFGVTPTGDERDAARDASWDYNSGEPPGDAAPPAGADARQRAVVERGRAQVVLLREQGATDSGHAGVSTGPTVSLRAVRGREREADGSVSEDGAEGREPGPSGTVEAGATVEIVDGGAPFAGALEAPHRDGPREGGTGLVRALSLPSSSRASSPCRGRTLTPLSRSITPDAPTPPIALRAMPPTRASRGASAMADYEPSRSTLSHIRAAIASVKTLTQVHAVKRAPRAEEPSPGRRLLIGLSLGAIVAASFALAVRLLDGRSLTLQTAVATPTGSVRPAARAGDEPRAFVAAAVAAKSELSPRAEPGPTSAAVGATAPIAGVGATSAPPAAASGVRATGVADGVAAPERVTGVSLPASVLGRIRVKATARCTVLIDGVARGTTPFTTLLPPGRHAIRLESSGGAVVREVPVDIRTARSVHLRVDLRGGGHVAQ